ncbi:MAG TPA: L-threonylcarbamoyladenylate synthase [Nitrospirales bacterium]
MNKLRDLSASSLGEAVQVVREGGVIAFPTETFYGLGTCPFNAQAVQRIFDLKGRALQAAPILVLIRSRTDLEALTSEIAQTAERLMETYWPGPLTLVFRASDSVPSVLTAGTGTIGIRLSAHADVQRLLAAVGGPLTGTSANRSGHPPATTAEEVDRVVGTDVDLILNGGETPGGLPSTVVDTTMAPPRLVREGRIPKAALLSILDSLAA